VKDFGSRPLIPLDICGNPNTLGCQTTALHSGQSEPERAGTSWACTTEVGVSALLSGQRKYAEFQAATGAPSAANLDFVRGCSGRKAGFTQA